MVGLWLGTELTIGGALAIARRHKLTEFFVGLVILSIGSDLPEIAVAVDAGIKGLMGQDASGVVVGTSIGSVVTQMGFVLGVGATISYLTLPRSFIFKHGAVLLVATVLLFDNAGDIHDWLTAWMPLLEVDRWYQWIWLGPAKAALALVGWLMFLAVAAFAFVLAMLAANLVSSPLLDLLAQRVEQIEVFYSTGLVGNGNACPSNTQPPYALYCLLYITHPKGNVDIVDAQRLIAYIVN